MAKAVVPSSIVFEVLEKDNYEDWRATIQSYLEFKDLWDVVESNEQPPDRDADEAKFKAWKKQNSEALHAIQISCGRYFLSKIRGIREANEAWRILEANFIPSLPRRMEYTSNPQQDDEENIDDEYKKACESFVDAFSKGNISDAIELCKKNPALLKERLPNNTPLLHELIMVSSSALEDKLVEMLNQFPKEDLEMRDSLGRTPLIAAVLRGAIKIAKCLVHMNHTLTHIPDDLGLIPLAVAIDFHNIELAHELDSITPSYVWTGEEFDKYGATVLTKCFEVWEFDFAVYFLDQHPRLTFAKDVNGISPLCAAARAPDIFSTGYKFGKFISNFLRLWLPQHSVDFEIHGIELLIAMKNAIKDLKMTSGHLRGAFFEAIKCGNFNFILMLIHCDKKLLEEVNDMSKNIYMCAIEYRQPKVFSLIFWDKNNWYDRKLYANQWQDKWKNNLLHMAATWSPNNTLDHISKPVLRMEREAMWYQEVSKLPMARNLNRKSNVDGKTPAELFKESHKDLMMEAEKWMKESASSWTIVGPLIISLMFAAAFQITEGYYEEQWFKRYLALVCVSFSFATFSVLKFLENISSNYKQTEFPSLLTDYNLASGFLFTSLAFMVSAFCLGIFLIVPGELALLWSIAALATLVVGYILCTKFHLLVVGLFSFDCCRSSLFEENIDDEVERIFEMLNRQPKRRW